MSNYSTTKRRKKFIYKQIDKKLLEYNDYLENVFQDAFKEPLEYFLLISNDAKDLFHLLWQLNEDYDELFFGNYWLSNQLNVSYEILEDAFDELIYYDFIKFEQRNTKRFILINSDKVHAFLDFLTDTDYLEKVWMLSISKFYQDEMLKDKIDKLFLLQK